MSHVTANGVAGEPSSLTWRLSVSQNFKSANCHCAFIKF